MKRERKEKWQLDDTVMVRNDVNWEKKKKKNDGKKKRRKKSFSWENKKNFAIERFFFVRGEKFSQF